MNVSKLENTPPAHAPLEDLRAVGTELIRVARQALTDHLGGIMLEDLLDPQGWLQQKRGVFVTLRNHQGELRGCRGTIEPQRRNLLEETRAVAMSSAFKDTRFESIQAEELPELLFEVSVLHPPEDVTSTLDLNPFVYGIIMRTQDGRRAVMLPNVDGLDTVEKQLEATRRKAFIQPGEQILLQRFRVEKFKESPQP